MLLIDVAVTTNLSAITHHSHDTFSRPPPQTCPQYVVSSVSSSWNRRLPVYGGTKNKIIIIPRPTIQPRKVSAEPSSNNAATSLHYLPPDCVVAAVFGGSEGRREWQEDQQPKDENGHERKPHRRRFIRRKPKHLSLVRKFRWFLVRLLFNLICIIELNNGHVSYNQT